jgi:hypothetical protein
MFLQVLLSAKLDLSFALVWADVLQYRKPEASPTVQDPSLYLI